VTARQAQFSLTIPGLPVLLDVALLRVMGVDPMASFAATNAVWLRIVPLPAPTIASIVPPSPMAGQNVTVTGTNFFVGLAAAVAGSVTPITVLGPTQAQFVMPAGVGCDAVLTVVNPGGLQAQRTFNATPLINNNPAASGPAAGGTFYLLTGNHLLDATVTFDGVPMSATTQTNSVIVGSTPPGMPGAATVVISNPNGCQTTRTFTYL
jgi:hypothetical protein